MPCMNESDILAPGVFAPCKIAEGTPHEAISININVKASVKDARLAASGLHRLIIKDPADESKGAVNWVPQDEGESIGDLIDRAIAMAESEATVRVTGAIQVRGIQKSFQP